MAYETITFDPSQVTDGSASGASGDNVAVAGGLVFTVAAQGNWTLDFSNNRLNFAEDPAFGGQQFKINVTAANGGVFRFDDFLANYQGSPERIGDWAATLSFLNNTSLPDTTFSANTANGDFRYQVPGFPMPESSFASTFTISDNAIVGTSTNPLSQFWVDNFHVDINAPPAIGNLSRSDDFTYVSGSGAIAIDHRTPATISDPDATGWNGGQLRVSYASGRVVA